MRYNGYEAWFARYSLHRPSKMAANETCNAGMDISQQPITSLIQIWCLFPHSRGQGSQWQWEKTDRKPCLQDFYLHRASKMAANEACVVEMALFHQPNTPMTQFLCLFPHSMGQGSQWWWDITDRKHGLHDSCKHRASKMAANEAYDIEMAIFHQPTTPIIQIWCLFPHSMGQGCQ